MDIFNLWHLEDMVGDILKETSHWNRGKGIVDPPTSSYAVDEHTFKIHLKNSIAVNMHNYTHGTTYAEDGQEGRCNVCFGGQGLGQDDFQSRGQQLFRSNVYGEWTAGPKHGF